MFIYSDCLYGAEDVVAEVVCQADLLNGECRELNVTVRDSETDLDPAIFGSSEFMTTYRVSANRIEEEYHINLLDTVQELVERIA